MFRRIRNGWELTKKSWTVLKGNPGLVKFPVAGAIVAIAVFIVTFVPGIVLLAIDQTATAVAGVVVAMFMIVSVMVMRRGGECGGNRRPRGECEQVGGIAREPARLIAVRDLFLLAGQGQRIARRAGIHAPHRRAYERHGRTRHLI